MGWEVLGGSSAIRRGMTGNLGNADWASLSEIRRLFRGPDQNYGGVVVGEAYRVDQDSVANVAFDPADRRTWGQGGKRELLIDPCVQGSGHSLIIAGSGAFKSQCALVTGIHWTGSAVFLDPACEIGEALAPAREAMGHDVFCLSPETAFECGTNVLQWIDIDDPLATTHVRSVVGWITGETPSDRNSGSSEFFKSRGRSLIACLLADMLWNPDLDWDTKTLRTLRKGLATPEKGMRKLLKSIHETSSSLLARDLAGTLYDITNETFSGIYATADEATSWLSNPSYAALVSGDTFRCSDLTDGKTTVFLQIPLGSLLNTPAVARVLVGALLNAVYQANGEMDGKVLFSLDEAVTLGSMQVLAQARDTGRKFGIVLQLLFQSSGQIEAAWGREGRRSWADGVSWRGYAAIQDNDTAKELSDALGTYGVLATSKGTNRGSSAGSGLFGNSSRGQNESQHEIKRPLMFPYELLQARTDEMFVLARGQKPMRLGRAIAFRRPEIQAELGENRFTSAEESKDEEWTTGRSGYRSLLRA